MSKSHSYQRINAIMADGERVMSSKFRTTPIKETIRSVPLLHKSAIIYKCEASSYWQFRIFLAGKTYKRSTKETEQGKAERKAQLICRDMLDEINGSERRTQPTSRATLQTVADALWRKNELRSKNGELHKGKVPKDKYVYEKHIKPFFKGYNIREIDTDALELFREYLTGEELATATQKAYINIVIALLKEAHLKKYIDSIPQAPRIRVDDNPRGYFESADYTRLWQAAKSNIGTQHEFKNAKGVTYRKTNITIECYETIMFMRNTFIRPTDLKVLKHKDVHFFTQDGIEFFELRHETTKRHNGHMVSTEHGPGHYRRIKERQAKLGHAKRDDYIFLPDYANRDTALDILGDQFTAVLEKTGLRKDADGKHRSLYSLRHTAIIAALTSGWLNIAEVAKNARTSVDMVERFYGKPIRSIRQTAQLGERLHAQRQRHADKARATQDVKAAKSVRVTAPIQN